MGPRFRRVELRSSEPLAFHREPLYLACATDARLKQALGVEHLDPGLDWARDFIVLAGRGECPTGGYTIDIDRLTLEAGTLVVRLVLSDPAPEDFVTLAVTYPMVAVAVSRRGLDRVRTVRFVDNTGKTLQTTEVEP